MKASVQQSQLARGLGIVSRAVSPRSTLPVLANVLLTAKDGKLEYSATNLELGIQASTPAEVEEEGAITVPARLLSDLVATLPADTVRLSLNEQTCTLTVKCGASSTEIKGIDAGEFPPMPVVDFSDAQQVKAGDLKEMVGQVTFAVSSDEARPTLQGAQTSLSGMELVMVATDGFRVSVRKHAFEQAVKKPAAAIVPGRALNELARILTDNEEMVSVAFPSNLGQVVFGTKDTQLFSQLIDGNFPDYKLIVPRSFKTTATISTAALLRAVRQAELIARNGNNVVRFNLEPRADAPGVVNVSAQSEETGQNEGVVDGAIDGPGGVIAFNVRFIREALEVIRTPNFTLQMNDHKSPALLCPVGDDSLKIVTMPMHLG